MPIQTAKNMQSHSCFSSITDESPRWLLATGRKEQARPVIKRLLQKNRMAHEDADVEEIINSTPVVEKKESKANIGDLLNKRTIAITTISFLVQ